MKTCFLLKVQRVVAVVWALALFGEAIFYAFHPVHGFTLFDGAWFLVIAGLIFGLLKSSIVAYRAVAVICLLVAIITPIGIFNPFTAGDYFSEGIDPPSVGSTAIWLVPMEIGLLFTAFFLDFRGVVAKPSDW
jgi:hypothetical protein